VGDALTAGVVFDAVAAEVERPGISWATTPTMTMTAVVAPATVHRNARRTRSKATCRGSLLLR